MEVEKLVTRFKGQMAALPMSDFVMESDTNSKYRLRKCTVNLEKLSEKRIKDLKLQVRRDHTLHANPRPRHASVGKQLHLLKKVCGQSPRGRPRKTANGQRVVASTSDSLMKFKIVTVPQQWAPSGNMSRNEGKMDVKKNKSGRKAERKTSGPAKDAKNQQLSKKITAVSMSRQDGKTTVEYFPCSVSSRFGSVGGKLYNTLHKNSAKNATQKMNMSCYVKARWPWSAQPQNGKRCISKQSAVVNQRKTHKVAVQLQVSSLPVPTMSPSVSSGSCFTRPMQARKTSKPKKKHDSDKMHENDPNTANSWVNELLSTSLATEVVSEAAREEDYLPDVSFLQNWTDDTGNLDIFSDILGSPGLSGLFEFPSQALGLSSSALEPQNGGKMQNADQAYGKCQFQQTTQKLTFYEELYQNDILLINAEDEPLPLPK